MDQKNDFSLRGIRCLLFDIFYKNNKLWLVLPVYDVTPFPNEHIHITTGGKILELTEEYVSTYYYGPTSIYVYDVNELSPSIDVTVEYESREKVFHLEHIQTSETPEMGLTTLCKDDYRLFIPFYKYYRDQGVSRFYIYYNGQITKEIKEFFQAYGNDVILIEWNYIYWLDEAGTAHHAQIGQMNHALYKYGKDNTRHMIFCDFDEYLHVPDTTLKQFVDTNKHINTFGFRNKWSQTIDCKIPDVFPTTFLTEPGQLDYPVRSKGIYKVSDVKTICVHHVVEYSTPKSLLCHMWMYHFYNWTRPERTVDSVVDLVTLSGGRA